MSSSPTVVLVHGAFADASSFAPVVRELLADGTRVLAPPVPNRSLAGDAEVVEVPAARHLAMTVRPDLVADAVRRFP